MRALSESGCTDLDGGATGMYGNGCSFYTSYPYMCSYYDDIDFTSSTMCCACGGGAVPPSPPLPPSPPPSPPAPPLQPGSWYAISSSDLIAALNDSAVSRIVLVAGTYEFAEDMCSDDYQGGSALCIDRPVTIEAEVAGSVVLNAKGARRVIYVSDTGTAELLGLNITGGTTRTSYVRLSPAIEPQRDARIISFV